MPILAAFAVSYYGLLALKFGKYVLHPLNRLSILNRDRGGGAYCCQACRSTDALACELRNEDVMLAFRNEDRSL